LKNRFSQKPNRGNNCKKDCGLKTKWVRETCPGGQIRPRKAPRRAQEREKEKSEKLKTGQKIENEKKETKVNFTSKKHKLAKECGRKERAKKTASEGGKISTLQRVKKTAPIDLAKAKGKSTQ